LAEYGIDLSSPDAITSGERGYVASFELENIEKSKVDELSELFSALEEETGVDVEFGATQLEIEEKSKQKTARLVPFYLLEGEITKIQEIKEDGKVETWYEDENGNRSVITKENKEDKEKKEADIREFRDISGIANVRTFVKELFQSWLNAGRKLTNTIKDAIKNWIITYSDKISDLIREVINIFSYYGHESDAYEIAEMIDDLSSGVATASIKNKLNKLSKKRTLKRKAKEQKQSEIEKEVEVDISKEDEVDKKESEDIDNKLTKKEKPEIKIEEKEKTVDEIKSRIWEESAKEILDEDIDIEEATENFYEKIIEKLSDELEADVISESEYKSLIKEIDDLKDKGVLEEDLLERIEDLIETKGKDEDDEEIEKTEEKEEEGKGITPEKGAEEKIELPPLPTAKKKNKLEKKASLSQEQWDLVNESVDVVADNFKEITGVDPLSLFNKDGDYDDELVAETYPKIEEYLNEHFPDLVNDREASEEFLYALDDKLKEYMI